MNNNYKLIDNYFPKDLFNEIVLNLKNNKLSYYRPIIKLGRNSKKLL